MRWTLLGCAMLIGACGTKTNSSSPNDTGDAPPLSDVPCTVATVLAKCVGCHGNPPTQAAPISLASAADLAADSPEHPGQSEAQRSLARMKDAFAPMPPKPHDPLAAAEIATFEAWVTAGARKEKCASPPAAVDVGPDPYAVDPVCTSGATWKLGDRGSVRMHPGGKCIGCHDSVGRGPVLDIGGTAYPSAHEPDDCNAAVPPGAQVEITEANGKVHTLTVNPVGNFYYQDPAGTFTTPYRAKIKSGGRERVMADPQTSGDCNACHTQSGDKGAGTKTAPGRILFP